MFLTFTTLFFVCYLSFISTIPITIYKNAQFKPNYTHPILVNLSSIESRTVCICQCVMNAMCTTATYNGHNQYCLLYSAQLDEIRELQAMTIDTNSSVISLKNKTLPVIETTSSSTLSTMATTVTYTAVTITAVATCTTLVTFDDIPGQSSTSGIIPNGYKNLNWTNTEYINASTMPTNSGYRTAVDSSPFVAHNPTGDSIIITTANSTRFSFDSVRLTSAWRDYLNVTMKTIRAGSTTSTGVYTAMTTLKITVHCSFCTDIDTIKIHAAGGTANANYTQNGTQFIIDDLCISFEH